MQYTSVQVDVPPAERHQHKLLTAFDTSDPGYKTQTTPAQHDAVRSKLKEFIEDHGMSLKVSTSPTGAGAGLTFRAIQRHLI